MIWSVENELNFINARNLGALDKWEPVLTRAWEAIQQVDPTRPMMVDGGGATRAQTLPVHGDHYSTKPFWNYPQLAYEANADQPRVDVGLAAAQVHRRGTVRRRHQSGLRLFRRRAGVPGQGRQSARRGQGHAGHLAGLPLVRDRGLRLLPAAVRRRRLAIQRMGAAGRAGAAVGLYLRLRSERPDARWGSSTTRGLPSRSTFAWKLVLDGREVAARSTTHQVPPGENEKFDVELPIPETARRLDGQWTLSLAAQGKEVFRARQGGLRAARRPEPVEPPTLARLQAGDLFVHDPQGAARAFLKSHEHRLHAAGHG